jgi:hypothetical protein
VDIDVLQARLQQLLGEKEDVKQPTRDRYYAFFGGGSEYSCMGPFYEVRGDRRCNVQYTTSWSYSTSFKDTATVAWRTNSQTRAREKCTLKGSMCAFTRRGRRTSSTVLL